MSGLQELLSSAFGSNACLYKDVLKCSSKATPSELRKAYHKRALIHHPDKQPESSSQSSVKEATLKFQALSAAYQLLSDPSQRAIYDATGRIPESVDADDQSSSGRRANRTKSTDEWVKFFQSVFQDIIKAGSSFDRKTYCGSQEERDDVLKYYQMCKGDRCKILACVVQSEQEDYERWWNDIIQPAIESGSIESYDSGASSMDANETNKKRKKLVRKRERPEEKAPMSRVEVSSAANDLEDTDDEASQETDSAKKARSVMNRREKMEFRVAKKRKEKKEREIEIAEIMQSKEWTTGSFAKAAGDKSSIAKRRNQHGLSDTFLYGLQEKFSNSEAVQRGKKKKIKRKW